MEDSAALSEMTNAIWWVWRDYRERVGMDLPEDSEGNHYYGRSNTPRQFIQFEKPF
jgi:hypothetical protein